MSLLDAAAATQWKFFSSYLDEEGSITHRHLGAKTGKKIDWGPGISSYGIGDWNCRSRLKGGGVSNLGKTQDSCYISGVCVNSLQGTS